MHFFNSNSNSKMVDRELFKKAYLKKKGLPEETNPPGKQKARSRGGVGFRGLQIKSVKIVRNTKH